MNKGTKLLHRLQQELWAHSCSVEAQSVGSGMTICKPLVGCGPATADLLFTNSSTHYQNTSAGTNSSCEPADLLSSSIRPTLDTTRIIDPVVGPVCVNISSGDGIVEQLGYPLSDSFGHTGFVESSATLPTSVVLANSSDLGGTSATLSLGAAGALAAVISTRPRVGRYSLIGGHRSLGGRGIGSGGGGDGAIGGGSGGGGSSGRLGIRFCQSKKRAGTSHLIDPTTSFVGGSQISQLLPSISNVPTFPSTSLSMAYASFSAPPLPSHQILGDIISPHSSILPLTHIPNPSITLEKSVSSSTGTSKQATFSTRKQHRQAQLLGSFEKFPGQSSSCGKAHFQSITSGDKKLITVIEKKLHSQSKLNKHSLQQQPDYDSSISAQHFLPAKMHQPVQLTDLSSTQPPFGNDIVSRFFCILVNFAFCLNFSYVAYTP
ncbi:unnamed protein product [Protopolystoma xenopodis]|uniref:Uncharacterized protein n=1 Tax=Protopolystoma xenopodis TaxID=117903 RepID=A0A3S5CIT9_9PLAT|nr:unnamed protein product [Protopolystoma xenopodis]